MSVNELRCAAHALKDATSLHVSCLFSNAIGYRMVDELRGHRGGRGTLSTLHLHVEDSLRRGTDRANVTSKQCEVKCC